VIEHERLQLLALGDATEDAAAVEEHVLSCAACAAALERLLAIGDGVRDAVSAGEVAFPVTPALAESLAAAGLVSKSYRLPPGGALPCSVGAADFYSLTTLEADLDGVARVDVVRTLPGGAVRMPDVPFDAARGTVAYVSRSDQLRALPSGRIRIELFAIDPSGERKIAEYFLDHTAFSGA
jgi:hypothetical protein